MGAERALLLLPLLLALGPGAALEQRSKGVSFRGKLRAQSLPSVHFLYTTGCNDYQLTHSIVLDHSWRAAGNRGRLTRIVADCASPEAQEMLSRSPLQGDDDFAVFFAKGKLDVIPTTGERYPARSRPHAVTQWFEAAAPRESVVALVDPDFVFLRPLSEHPSLAKVHPGSMVSTNWIGYGDASGAAILPEYKTGPVWLIATEDLQMLLPEWRSLTDSWEKVGDGLMREQFAFQKSAQQHEVPAHFVDDLASEILVPGKPRPYALHYFRSYNYGQWGFHKSLASSGWYADHFNNSVPPPSTCGAPLLQEPPQPPPDSAEALTLFTLLPRMNAAFKKFRELTCAGEASTFERGGLGAFGLTRLMHPIACRGQLGELTRYRVLLEQPADWTSEQALGSSRCSREAQMLGF